MNITIVRSLLPVETCMALSQAYTDSDKILQQGHQGTIRDNPVFAAVHEQLQSTMELCMGIPMRRGSSWGRRYNTKGFLVRHVDWGVNVLNIDVMLDAKPLGHARDWPLIIGDQPIRLDVGDAVMYPGSIPHHRDIMPDPLVELTIGLFCYYDASQPIVEEKHAILNRPHTR